MSPRKLLAGVGIVGVLTVAVLVFWLATNRPPQAPAAVPPGATQVASYTRPHATDVAAGFGSIWLSTGTGDTLSRIDPVTGATIATITFPYAASVLAVGPDVMWISSFDGNVVSRIDPATNKVTGSLDPGGQGVVGLVAAGGYIWAANHDGNPTGSVAKIDPATMKVVDLIPVGEAPDSGPSWITFGAGSLWVGVVNISSVVRIDPTDDKIIATIPVRGACGEIVASDNAVWVGSGCAPGVARIDPKTNKVTSVIGLPWYGPALAIDGNKVWFGTMEGNLARIDATTGRIVGVALVHGPAFGAAVGYGFLWVTDQDNGVLNKYRAT